VTDAAPLELSTIVLFTVFFAFNKIEHVALGSPLMLIGCPPSNFAIEPFVGGIGRKTIVCPG